MILIIGIIIAFFLAIIILTKKSRNFADIILGIWMVVIGIHLISYYGFITKLIFQYPIALGLNVPLPFCHGLLLYFYVSALAEPQFFKTKKWLIHLIIPIFVILLTIPFFLLSNTDKLLVFKNEGKGFENVTNITNVLLNVSGVFYIIITYLLLQRHKKRILNQFSYQDKINLNWLQFLNYMMVLMWFLIIFVQNDSIIFTAASIFVVFIGYFGIKQVGIFTNQNTTNKETQQLMEVEEVKVGDINKIEGKKYAKSGLNDDLSKDLHQKLKSLMISEKLHLEPEITLTELANRLEIHPNYLSQVINDLEGINFYDYINGLRVEEFKRLVAIPENQKYTLLALAFDCGFNSKSAFNRVFKKATNLSPSEYLKSLQ